MALVIHQMQDSFLRCSSRPLSWSKGMKLRLYGTTVHMIGWTENCSVSKHNVCLSAGASPVRGPKLKSLRVSAFKESFQNDKLGGRKSGSKLPKNWVNLKGNENTTVGPPRANDIPLTYESEANETYESITSSPEILNLFKTWVRMLRTQSSGDVVGGILAEPLPKELSETEHETQTEERYGILRILWCNFLSLNATIKIPSVILQVLYIYSLGIPLYLVVNVLYGAQVSKDLTPLWVLGPFVTALYVKMLQWLYALYDFSFMQTVKVVTNLPVYYQAAYNHNFHGELEDGIYPRFWQPVLYIKNLDYKKLSRIKLKVLQELIVEKYLDFVESIWPYYCRTIRFLKRANLI